MQRLAWLVLAAVVSTVGIAAAEPFALKKGEHICIIGNTLAERMQHFAWLETLLHSRFPQHELVIRNLAYSGDEIELGKRLRSRSFGSPDEWLAGSAPCPQPNRQPNKETVRENRFELTNTKADVIFAFFGYGESWADEAGLPAFKTALQGELTRLLGQKYNGTSAPRIVLFSPIAFQNLGSPNLPDGAEQNRRLAMYAAAMGEVAKAAGVTFVDLFGPTREHYAKSNTPLTINGIHQNEAGDKAIAEIIDAALFGPAPPRDPAALAKLRSVVADKCWHWYNRYRTTDGYSTYGDRAFLQFVDRQTNYEVLQRELDMLDVMTANREQRAWAVAQGKDLKIDDLNLPQEVPVKTNKPGPLAQGLHKFLSGEEAMQQFKLGKGLKAQLFASEDKFPELKNPVQMAFDTKGRLWVATWPTYPHWKPGTPMNDSLLILEDTNGDGQADVCKPFADDLHNPTGFEFWGGGVLVGQGPDLVFLKDTDGNDKYDVKERWIHGLDTADTHHTANSFTLDPGGALYFQEGTFHHTQVEHPWGKNQRCANGGVFRYEPRAQKFDVYVSYGFANPHGHVFDRWGQDFVTDGTGAQTYLAGAFSGQVDFPRKHGGLKTVYPQRTRPCPATEILSSRHFPEDWQGNFLVLNVIGVQGILRYKFADNGAGFSAQEQEPVLTSSDPNFRPTDAEMAPDGSLYFIDWQNPIIGHMQHNLRDPSRDKTHGRVYRVTHEGRDLLKPAAIAGESVEKLLELLKSPEDRVRYRAKIELSARPTSTVLASLASWIESLDPKDPELQHHLLEGLWVHQHHNVVNEALLKRVLASPDFRARAAATRVLCYWRDRVAEPLAKLRERVNDDAPRVRFEALRALSFFDSEQAQEIATESLILPQDDMLKYVFQETMRTLDDRVKAKKK